MDYNLSKEKFNQLLSELKQEYQIYAPVRKENKGTYSANDLITYDLIDNLDDIELNKKSKYSAKEIVFPIRETLFHFMDGEQKMASEDEEKYIIFLRPCDRNAFKRLDKIFLENGPEEDIYYKRLREKVKFFVIECTEGFDSCFCVSMDSNEVERDDYSAFLRFREDGISFKLNDQELKNNYFTDVNDFEKINFEAQFIQENKIKVNLPDKDKITNEVFENELWTEYSERCIACGRCNTSCPTCSCFTVKDVLYDENKKSGERFRRWAGCHIDGFTEMAGGHSFREEHGDRMRYKTMHKIYDFAERFDFDMCVGCGRCDDVCPEYISFSKCINKLSQIVEEGA
ncbi:MULTISPECIES: anaerobic sulfite reductase subunit AsrA [Halanaerobium]|jgi:anaerobic sulfite reductase subunit A|uniref:Anaerobic sulfite reductase subunit A n=1 Tax=Halanaerobium congolense TaxID=54121 RepID=A0A1G6KZ57_9FIRM|nr:MULTISPECIES: anaerobic sulfite reductase subunit AsrA [Halanaerobium]PTX15411.1 anaerobic sulfite reductase subunit A [Halanaerobium congolense]PUU89188.1 MAG: sulfite reductase, subunit A [Halanaerobium sp.]PUU91794.1 MAG: sulfite reductase, subunit A [Halanaerobium sp.]PXV68223.1 anaerobic sulfite reductase subunit A [Halanaerobium congolense]TDP15573.1 anaerobic sulfite reductase subunit A [Halanaerobium congolense]